MTDRWVNAVIEIVIPLHDVTVDSPAVEKQEAAAKMMARIAGVPGHAMSGRWEDVEDGEPLTEKDSE